MERRDCLTPEVPEAKKEYDKFIADEQKRAAELSHEMWLHDQAQSKYDATQEVILQNKLSMFLPQVNTFHVDICNILNYSCYKRYVFVWQI